MTEERQSTESKRPQPEGSQQKPDGGFVAPQSKTHEGYSLSSRLVGARFLLKRRYPEFFNRLLASVASACSHVVHL
jgi:hypothetical protein